VPPVPPLPPAPPALPSTRGGSAFESPHPTAAAVNAKAKTKIVARIFIFSFLSP
jgi:hypothetical protein